ncbi:hypothetical protein [Clostridium sulfidigenes]|uniref:hypothetical protein n=1 Tax=Clostridium sulfidigenes TaxID=318464 RepID=UPI003F8AD973
MDIEKIQKLIEILPGIFINIAPGFIFIKTYNYIFNIKGKSIKDSLLDYIVCSFIINLIIQSIFVCFNRRLVMTNGIAQFFICIMSLILAYIVSMALQSKKWLCIMEILNINRSNASNIFDEIIDLEFGTWIRAYIPSENIIYDGAFVKFEYKDSYDDSFIILDSYESYLYGESRINSNRLINDGEERDQVVLKMCEISRIEIEYDEASKKIIERKPANSVSPIQEKNIEESQASATDSDSYK